MSCSHAKSSCAHAFASTTPEPGTPCCRCELEPTNVDAGTCLYGAPHTAHLILTNTSRNTASWQFMPLPGVMFGDREDRVFRPTPRWASISPQQVR